MTTKKAAVTAIAERRAKHEALADKYASKSKLDPNLVKAVIHRESEWDPIAKSKKGAKGLMQLMPLTARTYKVKSTADPEQNVSGGTQYLKYLSDKYKDEDTSLAAYSMGETKVDKIGKEAAKGVMSGYIGKVKVLRDWYKQQAKR